MPAAAAHRSSSGFSFMEDYDRSSGGTVEESSDGGGAERGSAEALPPGSPDAPGQGGTLGTLGAMGVPSEGAPVSAAAMGVPPPPPPH
eukprot:323659-Prymnesium_polylepis.1